MIISSPLDYREAARRRLPPSFFCSTMSMAANRADLADIGLRQRVLRDISALSLETTLFGEKMAMSLLLAPIGLGA